MRSLRRLGFRVTTTTRSRVVLQDPKRGRVLTIPRHRLVSESELVLILLGAALPIDLFVLSLGRRESEVTRVGPTPLPFRLARRAG